MGMITFEQEQFLMDGKPYQILSGAMHYFRILPEYWEDRLKKLKACGFNTVETYVCWNLHERKEGEFDFSGRLDLVRYIEIAESLDLNVIVRPGPYICAEWDFGGLPSWLMAYPGMGIRCNDPLYLEKVRPYYRELFARIRPHLASNGGKIIMMQVENEYGSYGNDPVYMREVEKIYYENGIDCLLFTADGTCSWMLNGGTLPNLLSAANFGSQPKENFQALREFKQGEPLLCGEFWTGWFDHWYEEHHVRSAEEIAADTEEMLACGASFNFYMFHGGTNFGFTNGANHTGTEYQPTITSYDYCAPLSECGDLTPTYEAVKALLEKYTGVKAPNLVVSNLPKAAYGKVALTERAFLLDNLSNLAEPVHHAQPKTMEELGQDFGYILYTTTLRGPFEPLRLEFGQVHDRAIVYLNGKRVGLYERSRVAEEIVISLEKGETAKLDILVENMGRVNYGTKLFDQKGILGGIRLGQQFHFGWDMYCLTMEDLSNLEWQPVCAAEVQHSISVETEIRQSISAETQVQQVVAPEKEMQQPIFLRGTLYLEEEPADTFVRLDGWTKGFCMVNGFNLGRYFNSAGPQKTLYLPAPLLHKGVNEFLVFETDTYKIPEIYLTDTPQLG